MDLAVTYHGQVFSCRNADSNIMLAICLKLIVALLFLTPAVAYPQVKTFRWNTELCEILGNL